MIITILISLLAIAPTTQPSTKPSNGLGMTDEEIHQRLDDMAKKAKAASSQPSPSDPDYARRKTQYLQIQLYKMDVARKQYADGDAWSQAADEQLAEIVPAINDVYRRGSVVEPEFY